MANITANVTSNATATVTATITYFVTMTPTVTPLLPQSGQPTTWTFTADNVDSMSLATVGMTLGYVALLLSIYSVTREVCRKPLYWLALIEAMVSCLGLTTGVYYIANLFTDCSLKLWITTFPINASAVFMCAAMNTIAEATIVRKQNKTIFRVTNWLLIVAQFVFLMTRILTSTTVNNNSKGTCTITTAQVWRVLPLVLQIMSVLLSTTVFVSSLISKGLLQGTVVERLVSQVSKSKSSNTALSQQPSSSQQKIQNLAVRVQLLGLGLVLTTFVLFIFQMLSETGAQGAPSGSANTFFGLRTFFLSAVCYVNGTQLVANATASQEKPSKNGAKSSHSAFNDV